MRALHIGAVIVLTGCSSNGRVPALESSAIRWHAPIEIASGGGQRGEWRQNDSDYDYVDDPTVAWDARGDITVAWVDQASTDVYLKVLSRDGTVRSAPVNVSRSPGVFSWLPRVATAGDDVYILWQEIVFSGGSHGGETYFARSRDRGQTFEPAHNLSRSRNGDGKGRIDMTNWDNGSHDLALGSDGAIYTAWTEFDGPLWFSRSLDGGASFSAPTRIDDATRPSRGPTLAADGDTVYLAWTTGDDVAADLRLAISGDRGDTFSAPRRIANTKGYSDAPKLAVDRAGRLHLAWAESSGGPFERFSVLYTRSLDRGQTFEPARDLSHPRQPQSTAYPMLALDGNTVFVSWEILAKPAEMPRGLGLAYSLDNGTTFTAPVEVEHSRDPTGGWNGSHQGHLMQKLAVRAGSIVLGNSALAHGRGSRVWIIRGDLPHRVATRR